MNLAGSERDVMVTPKQFAAEVFESLIASRMPLDGEAYTQAWDEAMERMGGLFLNGLDRDAFIYRADQAFQDLHMRYLVARDH